MSSILKIENIKSLFIIFLIVSGNYLGDLIGCKMKYLLSENIYIKHLLLFLLIFITIGLVNEEKNRHPIMIFGFKYYLYEKRKEYKKNFNLFTFLLGKTNCRNN